MVDAHLSIPRSSPISLDVSRYGCCIELFKTLKNSVPRSEADNDLGNAEKERPRKDTLVYCAGGYQN